MIARRAFLMTCLLSGLSWSACDDETDRLREQGCDASEEWADGEDGGSGIGVGGHLAAHAEHIISFGAPHVYDERSPRNGDAGLSGDSDTADPLEGLVRREDAGGAAPTGGEDAGTVTAGMLDRLPLLSPPVVTGERSAGHPHPIWVWDRVPGAAAFRCRVDEGPWSVMAGDVATYRSTAPLEEGRHLFEVQVSSSSGGWSESGTFVTTVEYFEKAGFWNGVKRTVPETPTGHLTGVACHNCYLDCGVDSADSLSQTLTLLHAAQSAEADLLELDVKVESGTWYVDHNDDGGVNGAFLESVLDDSALVFGDEMLFIELKETAPTESDIRTLLRMLFSRGYAVNGRPVFIRSFHHTAQGVWLTRGILERGDFPLNAPYVRLSVLFAESFAPTTDDYYAAIDEVVAGGAHFVELDYRSADLFSLIGHARSLGVGVALWTVAEPMGEVHCASLRNEADILITDYPVDHCCNAVEEEVGLLYLNAGDLAITATEIPYFGMGGSAWPLDMTPPFAPSLEEDPSGTLLRFDASRQQHLDFYDADNEVDGGYLAALSAAFDDFDLQPLERRPIFNKAGAGGFAFELFRSESGKDTVLRFGVDVAGASAYATYPTAHLKPTQFYWLVGVYDGEGAVQLWVNSRLDGTTSSPVLAGGVTLSDDPVVLGADLMSVPEVPKYFSGRVRLAELLRWWKH